ncbi:uncharacterized protein [Typha latifolia]|uniref:uncharacterized protein n=1 Tax=Typha latifolia TaxID=4733 RepID=UPI003C2B133D
MAGVLTISGVSSLPRIAAHRRLCPPPRVVTMASSATTRHRNPYEVLRVRETATAAEIRAAYRSMAKQSHPDTGGCGGAPEEFIEIRRAYETLSDEAARARFDLSIGRTRFASSAGRRWETDQCW